MQLSPQQINIISQYFSHQPVLKAYLFGSFSRGEATQNSDIDLLVSLDYSQKVGLRFVTMQLELEDLLQKKIDLVSEKGLSPYIRPYIENDKQLIYER